MKSRAKSEGMKRCTFEVTEASRRAPSTPSMTSRRPWSAETTIDAPWRVSVRAWTLVMSTSVIVTPASRSLLVRDTAVPGRTRALTATCLLRRARAIKEPRFPAAPATATKLWGVDASSEVLEYENWPRMQELFG